MSDGKLTFANIVATPTSSSWSQAYTAGKLYAVLSLEQERGTDAAHLATVGKDIINALVEEYFTLETKDLSTIKKAVLQTTTNIPKDTTACLVVVSIVNTVLYAFSYGGGKVMLRRGDKLGTILAPADIETIPSVHAVSGFLQEKDMIILQTKQFGEFVSSEDLSSFATPSEAVEMLSPKIHGEEHGGASAIILSYQEAPTHAFEEDVVEPIPSPLQEEVAHREQFHPKKALAWPKLHIPLPHLSFRFPKKAWLFLLIPLILLGVLAFSLYTARQQQENAKVRALFDQVYPAAEKKYNEGQALLSLNKALAQDDFKKAKDLLAANINKFPKESDEYKKVSELFEKVKGLTQEVTGGTALTAKKTDASNSPLLAALLKNKDSQYAVFADTDIYLGSNTGIKTDKGKTVLENTDGWGQIGGLGTFGTNVYVLDTKGSEILKYVSGDSESKSTYATDASFSQAIGMAIDGSIYVLTTDGMIKKYTRGKPDAFGISGLETPLKKPLRIFTNPDIDNLYILDTGNSRIVVLNKAGEFQDAYAATVIKDAKDFDVQESEKKIYVLSAGNVYEINIP